MRTAIESNTDPECEASTQWYMAREAGLAASGVVHGGRCNGELFLDVL